MVCDQKRGTKEVLDTITDITGQTRSELADGFHARKAETPRSDRQPADPEDVRHAIRRVITRLHIAPAITTTELQTHLEALADLIDNPPELTQIDLEAWSHLLRHTPEAVPTIDRPPVEFPALSQPQADAWHVLLDLEADPERTEPWVLVGGQMVLLHALENGLSPHRATNDGDIVLGVWTRRDALKRTSRFLTDRDFVPTETSDNYGYRFERGDTQIDLLLPEGMDRQTEQPSTSTGKPGLAVEGGNQALRRAERVPVHIDARNGHIRRPNLLGSLVAKACALIVDNRDTERHAEDIAILGQIALGDLRRINDQTTANDRRRLRKALTRMETPRFSRSWETAEDPAAVQEALHRLARTAQDVG